MGRHPWEGAGDPWEGEVSEGTRDPWEGGVSEGTGNPGEGRRGPLRGGRELGGGRADHVEGVWGK